MAWDLRRQKLVPPQSPLASRSKCMDVGDDLLICTTKRGVLLPCRDDQRHDQPDAQTGRVSAWTA